MSCADTDRPFFTPAELRLARRLDADFAASDLPWGWDEDRRVFLTNDDFRLRAFAWREAAAALVSRGVEAVLLHSEETAKFSKRSAARAFASRSGSTSSASPNRTTPSFAPSNIRRSSTVPSRSTRTAFFCPSGPRGARANPSAFPSAFRSSLPSARRSTARFRSSRAWPRTKRRSSRMAAPRARDRDEPPPPLPRNARSGDERSAL